MGRMKIQVLARGLDTVKNNQNTLVAILAVVVVALVYLFKRNATPYSFAAPGYDNEYAVGAWLDPYGGVNYENQDVNVNGVPDFVETIPSAYDVWVIPTVRYGA